jgi:hypothetical protein
MDNRLTLGKVHIVEWLRPGDMRTGKDLYDELEPLGIVSKPPVEVAFNRIHTRDEFLGLLRDFKEEFANTGRTPLLHIETHGNQDGIGADEGIGWVELAEELIAFNHLTRLNLVVIFAACEGFYGAKMLQPNRRASACRGLIGPNRQVKTGELADGCLAFYRTIFAKHDGDAALLAMNNAVDTNRETFWLLSAEEAFKIVNRGYFEERCSPEALAARVDAMLARLSVRFRVKFGTEPSQELVNAWRRDADAGLSDHKGLFEKLRLDFFFINDYPENDERFDIKFEDCWPDR